MISVVTIQNMDRLFDGAEAGYGVPFGHLGEGLVAGTMSIDIPPSMLSSE